MHCSIAMTLILSVAGPALAQDGGDDWSTPRVHLALSGGRSMFRGGDPGVFLPFQPDGDSITAGGTLAFRLARHIALEAGVAGAWGDENEGRELPDNLFLTGGFKFPVLAGRFVPYVTLGGALVTRESQDEVDEILEDAFEVNDSDPAAYGGAGLEFRLTRLLGIRGDYRYFRVFPEDVPEVAERESFGIHRILGGVTFSF